MRINPDPKGIKVKTLSISTNKECKIDSTQYPVVMQILIQDKAMHALQEIEKIIQQSKPDEPKH